MTCLECLQEAIINSNVVLGKCVTFQVKLKPILIWNNFFSVMNRDWRNRALCHR
jgi:hypothetical protein